MKTTKTTSTLMPLLIAVLIAFPGGIIAGSMLSNDTEESTAVNQQTTQESDKEDSQHEDSAHEHMLLEVNAEQAPAISNLQVVQDSKSGWNVSFDTENFEFSPENASSPHVDGQGHAHIYVDGKKISRLYGADFYLGDLAEGSREITVSLNTNDHQDYAVNGQAVAATVTVVDDHHKDDEAKDDHSHSDDKEDAHSHSE